MFFLTYSPITFVALVETGSEGFEHLLRFLHCIYWIGLSSLRRSSEVRVCDLITLGCLYSELVPIGYLEQMDFWTCGLVDYLGPPIKL
jgi:hypothetical protein